MYIYIHTHISTDAGLFLICLSHSQVVTITTDSMVCLLLVIWLVELLFGWLVGRLVGWFID